jgi:hypothetical protein
LTEQGADLGAPVGARVKTGSNPASLPLRRPARAGFVSSLPAGSAVAVPT